MARKLFIFKWIAIICISLFILPAEISYTGSNEDMTSEKLIEAHINSIGKPAVLSKVQSITFLGNTNVNFVIGQTGSIMGNALFVSQGPKLAIALKYGDTNYPGEYFAYDGQDVTVAHIRPGQKSPIADFLFRFNKIIKNGLIGGTLSNAWPLLDIKNKNADIKYRKAKVDGVERHELEYHPRNGFGDIKIRMYFDMTTFQHVRTEYRVRNREDSTVGNASTFDQFGDSSSVKGSIGGGMAIGQVRGDTYYTLVEKFEDYKKIGGMTLPHRYRIEYSTEGHGTFIANWTINVGKWGFNAANLDPKIFKAEK